MRILAFLLVLLLSFTAQAATTYYVGPTSAGSANGTSEANRWGVASVGWSTMTSGDTLLFSIGTYTGAAGRFNINSTSANYSATNPLIIDGNNQTIDVQQGTTHALYIKAAAGIRIKNLTITGANADNIRLDGSDGTIGLHDVTLYNIKTHHAKQCGIDIDGLAYNITIDHVSSYLNYDSSAPGNSDGFCTHFAAGAGGSGIVIQDSEFYCNSDDGLDFFQTNNAITVRRLWVHDNGYFCSNNINTGVLAGGDGRCFALGPGTGAHVIESTICARNAQFGIHRRDNSAVVTLRENTIHGNGMGIAGGRDINFPSSVDLNFPTSQTRFTDSGVNTEYRALSQPVSSLSVGAQAYTLGTVGVLASNQYGYSAPYVYVKGNPGTATVTAVPTTQSIAYNNWSSNCGLNNNCNNSDTVTGLTTTAKNSWDLAITKPNFIKPTPITYSDYCLNSSSALKRAGVSLNIGNVQDQQNRAFHNPPSIGACESASGDVAASRTAR